MRIHTIMHVPFEGPGEIAAWAAAHGHALSDGLALLEAFPPVSEVDLLLVMGGPMAADDEAHHQWLVAEKRYIADAIRDGALVLGVCLGAQIIAQVLGGTVRRSPSREIGFWPVHRASGAVGDPIFGAFPRELVVGHWHGDTFDLPGAAQPALSSEATANQAFSARGGRVVGLQFHLEWSAEGLRTLALECADEIEAGGEWVTPAPDMLEEAEKYLPVCREELFALLDRLAARMLPDSERPSRA